MSLSARLAALPLLAFLTLLPVGPTALAQDTNATDERLVAEARELRASIEQALVDIENLKEDLATAEGDDALVARRRLRESRLEGLDDLRALTANVVRQDKAGLDTSELRSFLEPILREVTAAAHRIVGELEAARTEAGTKREGATPEELEALEQTIARDTEIIDRYWVARVDNLEDMKSLGMEVDEEEEALTEELPERAETIATSIKLILERREELGQRLKATPESADLQAELRALDEKLGGATTSLETTVELLKRQGLDATEYQHLLIESTGTISTDLLDTKVVLSLTQKWIQQGKDWLAESGPNLIFRIFVFFFILFLFRILAKAVRKVVRRAMSTSKLRFSQLLQDLVINLSSRAVMLLGLLVALSQIGFSLGPLLAGLGVAGFIVGFALQDTLANFAAGAMILIYRPFDVGDMVEAGGVFGKVERMTLVSTTILTIDNQTLIVPNSKIWGDVIRNVTAQKVRRVDMTFGISYGDDIPHAETVLNDILAKHEKVLEEPEPVVRLHTLGESSVDFVVRPWVKTDDYWDVYWDVTREVKMRFDSEGISIPFPQRDVHLFPQAPPEEEAPPAAAT